MSDRGFAGERFVGQAMSDAARLLGAEDPPPFRAYNEAGAAPILLVCDHASNAVPRRLGSLGLPPEELARHIGWDIGAEAVARDLAIRLGAPAIASGYSRLVIDNNRDLANPTSIPEMSDETRIPGNVALEHRDREARANEIYWPYHRKIAAILDDFAARGVTPAVISVHSFTPRMKGFDRPWHVGVLWDQDASLAIPLMRELARGGELTVGDNEPYTLRGPTDFTIPHHAVKRGLSHVMIEIRQNEIASPAGVSRYAALIHAALGPILSDRLGRAP